MEFTAAAQLKERKKSDLLVLPFWKGSKKAEKAFLETDFDQEIAPLLESGDFLGKEQDVVFLYGAFPHEKRVVLLGLGDKKKLTVESLRRSFGVLTKQILAKKLKEVSIVVPLEKGVPLSKEEVLVGVSEGLLLANYVFNQLKSSASQEECLKPIVKGILIGVSKQELAKVQETVKVAAAVYFARDLVNENADKVTPQYLAQVTKELGKTLSHVEVKLFDKKQIEKEKMGLLLAVNQGSHLDPFLGVLSYKGNPKSKELTVIVGKGVTYDTGGLNLKPTGSMETMKCDMSGAATVLGTFLAVATLGLKVNLTAVVVSTENSIGPKSYKPGDVYTSYLGKTVEVGNTDAEGRLILADALAYACKTYQPTRILNFATLTGAIDIALGKEASGLFSNNDELAKQLAQVGESTFERVWRLPLYEEYKEMLKSDIADLKNVGGRSAGSITAALFLEAFIGNTPWAHLDIASTAFLSEPKKYLPKHATGVGVRLMVQYLKSFG